MNAKIPSQQPVQPTGLGGGSSPYIPFSVCSGCASPFHLECLLDGKARAGAALATTSSGGPRKTTVDHPSRRLNHQLGLTPMQLHMTGYNTHQSALNSPVVARTEVTVGAVFLCSECLAIAGNCGDSRVRAGIYTANVLLPTDKPDKQRVTVS